LAQGQRALTRRAPFAKGRVRALPMAASPYFDRRPLLGHRSGSLLPMALMGVGSGYVEMTGEAAEAAVEADKLLADRRPEDCLKTVLQALDLFKKDKHEVGTLDCLMIMINAQKMSADLNLAQPAQALKTVKSELGNYKNSKRGSACMKLVRAELNSHTSRGGSDLQTALTDAEEAMDMFSVAGDDKMKAYTQLVLVNIYFKRKRAQDVQQAAVSALDMFSALADKSGQAKALHGKALAHTLHEDWAGAVKCAQKAASLYSELEQPHSQAFELSAIARWQLLQGRPNAAMETSKKLYALIPGRMELCLMCEAAVASGRASQAVTLATDAIRKSRAADNALHIVSGMAVQTFAELSGDNPVFALDTAKDAVQTAMRYKVDREIELNLLYTVFQANMKNSLHDAAVKSMRDAASIARQLKDLGEEADALRNIAAALSNTTTDFEDEQDVQELDEAIEAAQSARALYNEAGLTSDEASAIMISAVLKSRKQPGSQELMSLAEEAQQLYHSAADVAGEILASNMVVDLYMSAGKIYQAVSFGASTVEMCRQAGRKNAQAEALNTYANIQMMVQDSDGAAESIAEAQNLCYEVGAKKLAATLAILLVQLRLNEFAANPQNPEARIEALKVADVAVLSAKQAGEKTFYGVSLTWRAQVLTALNRGAEALLSSQLSEKAFAQAGDLPNQVRTSVTVAELLAALDRKSEATDAANKAIELASTSPDFDELQKEAQGILSRMTARSGPRGGGGKRIVRKLVKKWRKKSGAIKGGLSIDQILPKVSKLAQNVLTDDGGIELDSPFMEAGVDSLGSVQLLTDVGKEFQLALAPSAIFDYPNIRELSAFLMAEGAGGGGKPGPDEWEEFDDWEETEVDEVFGGGGGGDGGGGGGDMGPSQPMQQLAVASVAAAPVKQGLDIVAVKAKLMDLVKNVLQDDEEVFVDSPFMEAGIDSLGSVQLLTDVGKEFGMALAPSAVFDYPSVYELAEFLVAESKES